MPSGEVFGNPGMNSVVLALALQLILATRSWYGRHTLIFAPFDGLKNALIIIGRIHESPL